MSKYSRFFYDYFISSNISESTAEFLNMAILLVILIVVLWITDFITRKVLVQAFNNFASRSSTNFDNLLVKHKAPRNIAHIVPLLITIKFFPIVFYDYPHFEQPIETILKLYTVFLIIWIIRSVLKTFESYFQSIKRLKDKPIASYIQVVMIALWVLGIAVAVVIVTDISILKFFTTLGAASAVMLLIFKDTILGFVASIQFAVNDTIRIGDWITMTKYGADGDVIAINLNNVQVQNFDKTITIIPTYAFISEAYTNWRGMEESGGRRIKRSLTIKANSITYLTDEDIQKLKTIDLISNYIESRQDDINAYNEKIGANKELLINGRNLTNLGVFRKYAQEYVTNHSAINKDMTIMIRQLAPNSKGIPLEVYAFSSDKRWANYEYIMADIFDHLLAAVPYFQLEIFEDISGKVN
ncbi:mechanosensitive ion channel family protein [Hanstruepera marina]|uniref:mechanosensitive ion channel family protein n=1 Tax=Hanstruepera marina TaxID=2873265 RepID=UPI001CA62F6D|nr:mechanosensitive ion channel domain-containing protein [Hanstruepera marina]